MANCQSPRHQMNTLLQGHLLPEIPGFPVKALMTDTGRRSGLKQSMLGRRKRNVYDINCRR